MKLVLEKEEKYVKKSEENQLAADELVSIFLVVINCVVQLEDVIMEH